VTEEGVEGIMKKYCFGIDIGGTTVKCGFFNTEGDLLEKWEIPTRTEENGSRILPDIAQTINDKIAERGLDKGEIEGIGIDVPGPVHEDGHVDFAVNLHWGVVDIVGEMEKLTGIRTRHSMMPMRRRSASVGKAAAPAITI
jgi:glucokinase